MDREEQLSIRISSSLSQDLRDLSRDAERSVDELVSLAVQRLIATEKPIVAAINDGLSDSVAGQAFAHDEVMDEMAEIIAQAEAKRLAASA